MQVGDGVFEVLSTSGDTHLGGDDFDKRIVDFLAEDFKRTEGMDLRKDRQVRCVQQLDHRIVCLDHLVASVSQSAALATGPAPGLQPGTACCAWAALALCCPVSPSGLRLWEIQSHAGAARITSSLLAAWEQALQRLTEAAEKAKMELSTLSQTSISLPFITATQDGPKHIDANLSRAKFEDMCSDLLDRCATAFQAEPGLGPEREWCVPPH